MRPLAAVLVLLAGLAPVPVGAQADTTATDTAAAGAAIPLAPIRVTVLRTPLQLAETPYAVTVERPAGTGPGLTLAESLGAVPGLQVDNRYNFSQGDRLSVRGLGARAQFGVRGVKVLVDGIPATLPDGQTSLSHVDPRWIERAEVVRGPASSLWGNASGGVVQLGTGDPPEAGLAASASVTGGSHGLTRYGGQAGWGVRSGSDDADRSGDDAPSGSGSWLGFRASASRLLYDGFRVHASADKRFGSARVDWRRGADELRLVAHAVAYEADNPGSLSDALLAEDRTQAYAFNVAQGTGESARQAQLGATWRRHLGGGAPGDGRVRGPRGRGSVLEVTAWALTRDLDNPIPPVVIDLRRWAAGLRASIRGGAEVAGRGVDWVAGVDAEGQFDDRLNFENDGGARGALVLDQVETVTSVAPFVEARVPVAGPVAALAGLRFDRYRFTADDHVIVAGDPSTDDSGSRVMTQLSPSLGLTADVGGASVYGAVASSFETPTTTELVNRPGGAAGFNPDLRPQRTWSLEAGVRTGWGGVARLHGAVYRMAIRDALIPFEDPSAPGRTFFRNAGSAVHRGVELDGWIDLGAGATARLAYTWTDARFDEFVTPDGDFSENRVPGVAPHRATGTVSWSRAGARIALEARWSDAIPVNDANTARAPSHALLGLRAGTPTLSFGAAAVEVFAGADNLLDTAYIASVVVNAFGARYYEPGPGRSVYLGVRVAR